MKNQADLVDFIKNQKIFENLSIEELELVKQTLQLEKYSPGDYIIKENDHSQDIYFIKNGEVEVVKLNPETGQKFVIGKLQPGDMLGEMAFIDGQPRSSSVRVISEPALVYKLPVNWSNSLLSVLYDKILEKIVQVDLQRLRVINQHYIQNLKQQISEIDDQNHFGYFFIFMVTIYNLNSLARVFLAFDIKQSHFISLICFSLLLFLPTAIFLRHMNYSFADFGMSFQGIRPVIKNTFFIVSGFLLTAIIFSKGIETSFFFNSLSQVKMLLFHWNIFAIFFYIFCIEFTTRGAIQTSLQRFLYKGKKIGAVLLTALILWPVNLYLGFELSFAKFLIDLFLGALFIQQKNLFGVTLLHFLIVIFTRYG